ncbi:universal stress protein [Williamsia sterculiae]|uniref:Nucleotide-binding universal stress protein, UspA family n=1 Tax=Williamsia sterculiae TaxID=1344003 RepID=A0A1N7FDD3_9NOCA|nr:universal stress protein [Williamsia sterculiae]SIR98323.1 Nucleotide-binding universal stress protein, UspA family [Williamsia sterculiae]
MTILAGFSAARHGVAPLALACQIAGNTGEPVIAAAIVERRNPPMTDPVENEYLDYVTTKAEQSLRAVVDTLPPGPEISVVVHRSTSIPSGISELAQTHDAQVVTVGSSSSGLLGRITLGSVTDRLVHTAAVPVAIAPRGYGPVGGSVRRVTAAFGGLADVHGLVDGAARLARQWRAELRVASFSARDVVAFSGSIESGAEDLVIDQWWQRTRDRIAEQLDEARVDNPGAEVVIGVGRDWRRAVEDVPWAPGDLLLVGSGAAGLPARVFLGSAGSRIVRHSPVPVMIMPSR